MQFRGELTVERRLPREESEEQQLCRAAAAGERVAFETLVSRHREVVSRVAARLLGDPDEVQDAVQETFLRGYQQLHRFRGDCPLRAWLISIAVNVCRSRRREFGRWRRFLSLKGPMLLPPAPEPSSQAEGQLQHGELGRAVAALPEPLRLPFTLRFYEDLSGKEIAAALGWNESTVWSRIYAAQRELRKQLIEKP